MPPIKDMFKSYVAKRLFGYGPTDDWSYVDQFTGPAKDIKLLGMYSGLAYLCISTIAESIGGKYEPHFYTKNAQGKEITIPNHPLLPILQAPNPDITFYDLFEGSASFIEQFGEFFWYCVPGSLTGYTNGIKEIYLLRPDKMGIVLDKSTGEVIGYNYSAGTGQSKIPFTTDEIMHYMKFNPKNPYRGYSTLEAAIEYVVTEQEVSRFTRNYFRNNAAMSGILEVSGKLTRENWNKFIRQWRERYEGPDNAGKIAMIRDSQAKFTQLSSNLSDMQLTDLKENTVNQLMMMWKIPQGLFGMGDGEGLGRASVETLEYIFTKWNIDPKLSRFDDLLQRMHNKYYGSFVSGTVYGGHKNIIPADKNFELLVYQQGVDKWITRKEIRDKDPELANNLIDGTDELFVLNTQLPISDPMSSEQAASKPVTIAPNNGPASGGDGTDEDDDDDNPDGNADDGSDKQLPDRKANVIKLVKSKKKDLSRTIEQKEAFRQGLQDKATEYVGKYQTAFNAVLDKQKATVLSNIGHLGKAVSDDLLNPTDEAANFNAALAPVLTTLLLEQGQTALDFSGAEDVRYKMSQSIQNAIKNSTQKMAKNFDDETLSELNDTLTEGISEGETIQQLSQRVSVVYEKAVAYRSDRVARTETQSAANSANLDAYKQNPAVTAMEWFANPGACPYCDQLSGTEEGLEETFVAQGDSVDVTDDSGNTSSYQADYGNVDTPPLHPNCSCTIIPVTISS